MNIKIYTDGGARGNPGPAGIGVVVFNNNDEVLEEYKEYIGIATNNIAEYKALLHALELARKYAPCSLQIYLDSELIYNQMLGSYKVKNEKLLEYFVAAQKMLNDFEKVDFVHVKRDKNKLADKLVNQAINIGSALHAKKD
ncbi:MAG: ribonuclease HI family protein [Endomicrobiales bacterium]|nr:ribonuclease HI family protein [Endomicrobiales bacterium]